MKKCAALLLVFILCSCQKEEFKIIQKQPDDMGLIGDMQLTNLVRQVVSHDGSFDDIVDDSSCFSIKFPYICNVGNRSYPVNSAVDLEPFTKFDDLRPTFPVTLSFGDYNEMEVVDYAQFQDLINQCGNGQLYDERITCIDFTYPVTMAVFNTTTSNFETISLPHDEFTFETIDQMTANDVIANINYPITMIYDSGQTIVVTSDDQLRLEILSVVPLCN